MRRTALFGTIERIGVSIHASVKDATDNISATDMLTIVSIHASVKDATLGSGTGGGALMFQSTHL